MTGHLKLKALMTNALHILTLTLIAMMVFAACDTPGHIYSPPGEGRIIYDPERGLIRQAGDLPAEAEDSEALFRSGMLRFNQRKYEEAAARLGLYRQRLYPDGPRALEAVIWESIAKLENARGQDSLWLADHLANAYHDEDPQAYAALGLDPNAPGAKRGLLDLARNVASNFSRRELNDNWELSQEIFVYYSAGLAVQTIPGATIDADDLPGYQGLASDRSFFTMHARHTRNLAWFALLAGQPRISREAASFLEKRTQNRTIRNPALLILAEASLRLDLPYYAEQAYHDLAASPGVSPIVQEQALYGEVLSIIAQSKGAEYDVAVYERAEARIDEYKAGFFANHPNGSRLLQQFYNAKRELMQIEIEKLDEAMKTYDRVFEDDAAAFYQRRSNEVRAKFEALTLERFSKLPGVNQLGGGR